MNIIQSEILNKISFKKQRRNSKLNHNRIVITVLKVIIQVKIIKPVHKDQIFYHQVYKDLVFNNPVFINPV